MKSIDIKRMFLGCCLIISSVLADETVMPQNDEVYDIPPRMTTLVEHARAVRSQKELKKIEKIVKDSLKKKKRSSGKKRSVAKSGRRSILKKNQFIACATLSDSDGDLLLSRVYQDAALSATIVSLNIKKTSVKKAIELLAQRSSLPFVVDPSVTNEIEECKVDNVPVAVALQLMLDGTRPRLGIIKQFDVWRIVHYDLALQLLKTEDRAQCEHDQSSICYTMRHAKWDDAFKARVQKLWDDFLGDRKKNNGTFIAFDDATKKIFFKSRQQQVADFKYILEQMDQKIPQVSLEMRVIIADKNFDQTLGFLWSGRYNRNVTGNKISFGVGAQPDITTPFGNVSQWSLNLIPGLQAGADSLKALLNQKGLLSLPLVFKNQDMSKLLNVSLNAAENRNEIKTILKPSLLVNSRETAEILVGESIPLQTRVDEAVGANISNVTTTHYKDLGIKVQVTPQVCADNDEVFLDVFLENSALTLPSTVVTWQQDGKAQSLGYAIKTSRSKNRVILKSGQTTLISGLIINSTESSKTGVPGLEKIPVIGWLFKGTKKVQEDKQLLIFITPIIV
ncbi:MAG: Type II and III secretion system protein [candidate division TM6 bacterium GW2011_GWF2_38_10]|nr:MAG: Type II and III secretion system protein [candidate division TM6 bacterium GW2011_GWF2_38_10]